MTSKLLSALALSFVFSSPSLANPRQPEVEESEISAASVDEADLSDEAEKATAAKVVQRAYDAYRAGDFEKWLSCYSSDVVLNIGNVNISGKSALRKIYAKAFKMKLRPSVILESGWVRGRVYIVQTEFLPDGSEVETYAEFLVQNGSIVAVDAVF